jgi:hypothetical protein
LAVFEGNLRPSCHLHPDPDVTVASAACAVGGWTTVLELLLSLEPSAVRVLTEL